MKLKYPLLVFFLFLGVCSASAQNLWGVTSAGVADNKGVIYKTNADGTGYAVQHNFASDFPGTTPMNSLTLANGKFYGLTSAGGANDLGIIFEYDPVNDTYVKKFDFSTADGSNPQNGLLLASDGHLYGMTTNGGANSQGVLFEYDPVGDVYTKRHDFSSTADGAFPQGNLIQAANSKLYGMAPEGGANGLGTLFEYNTASFTFTKKVDFATASGATPRGDLVEVGGNLYGMTSAGGANGKGTIFEYVTGGTSITNKVDFSSASTGANPVGSLTLSGGKLYGMTQNGGTNSAGTLFEYVAGNTAVTKKFDFSSSVGANPQGSLVQALNGKLYGLGFNGGTANEGTIFEYDPVGVTLTKKVEFSFAVTGGNPLSNLSLAPSGNLYGMNAYGGPVTFGTLFEYVPGATSITKKVDFSTSSNGSNPQGGLAQGPAPDSFLYGLASNGGANSNGVLFEIDPSNNNYQNKVDFSSALNGAFPSGGLVLAANNKFYGLTSSGGSNGDGVLFEYVPGTFSVTNRFNFAAATSGSAPQGSLSLASNGKLYGMTSQGGANGNGVLFEFDPSSSSFAIKYNFPTVAGGTNPKGSLVLAANGKFYGMTNQGGSLDIGVIFEYDVATSTYTKKTDFTSTNGSYPYGDLAQGSNGKLYGLTSGGGTNSAGVIFEFDPVAGTTTVKYNFIPATTGSLPQGTLFEVAAGIMFGTTYMGGAQNYGVLFKYDFVGGSVTGMHTFDGLNGANPQFGSLLLVPGKQAQSISFAALPGKVTSDVPFALTATASSGLPVTYTSSDPSIASIPMGSNIVTINSFGTVIITASQGGDATHSFAQNVDQALVISRAGQTITFGALAAKTYGDAPFTISATASSGLPVSFSSGDPSIATISGNLVTIVKAGNVIITASQAGDATYNPAANVTQSLVINKKSQSISFVPPTTKTYGDAPFTLVATASSGLTVIFSSPDPTVSIVGNQVTILQAGTATITASQPGDGNYLAAPTEQRPVFIDQATQTITFNTPPTKAVGDAPFDLTGTVTSGLPLTYVSGDNSIATITGTTVAIWNAGTVTITASQPGNVNYLTAVSVQRSLVINKGNQTITFGPLGTKSTADPDFNLTATASSALGITYVSSNPSVATVSGSIVHIVGIVGATTITASQPGNSNYNAATPVNQVLNVTLKLSQSITFSPIPAKKLGDNPFSLVATASSGLPLNYVSSNTGVATVTGGLVFIVGPGTTTITASQPGDATYSPALDVSQDLVVNRRDQTITFAALPSKKVGDPPFALSATASSGLPVSYASSNPGVATVTGNMVTIVGLGITTITASQGGNASYSPAQPVYQDLGILVTGDLPDPARTLLVYPSPTKEKLWVDLQDFLPEPVQMRITDMTGRSYLAQAVNGGGVTEIMVADQPAGMYLLKVAQGGRSVSAKYIKQ